MQFPLPKRKRRILIWSALGALLLILLALPGPKKIDVKTEDAGSEPRVTSESIREEKSRPPYMITAEYPVLEGLSDAGIQERVNEDIKKRVMDQAAAFRQNAASVPVGLKAAEGDRSEFKMS